MEPLSKIGPRLPEDLYRRVKKAAIDVPCSAGKFIAAGMESFLSMGHDVHVAAVKARLDEAEIPASQETACR